jgi:hypothetical protein
MPDWRFFRDREGNRYYLDRAGKIRTLGEPEFIYRAVSAEGIDYYLNQGRELVLRHYQLQGLTILKSILSLPVTNNRIRDAQEKASREINRMQKRGGTRFHALNRKAALIIYREGNRTNLINDLMYYSLVTDLDISILKNRLREKVGYAYNGTLLGFNLKKSKEAKKRGFDFLMAIDSEKYRMDIKSIEIARRNWMVKLGLHRFKRELIRKSQEYLIYRFSNRSDPQISGYEGIYYNGHFSYIIRIIVPGEKFNLFSKEMEKIINSFRVVKGAERTAYP